MGNITKIDKKGNTIATHPISSVGNFKGICYIGVGYFAVIQQVNRDLYLVLAKLDFSSSVKIIKTLKTLDALNNPHGVCTDGKFFYVLVQASTLPISGKVFKLDKKGNTIKIFSLTTGSLLRFRALTFNGKHFFATEIKNNEMWQLDQNFNLIRTFPLPENLNRGACFDGVNLWVGGATNDDLYCLDYQGNVKNQIMPSAGNLVGVATDGKYFYLTQ